MKDVLQREGQHTLVNYIGLIPQGGRLPLQIEILQILSISRGLGSVDK